MEETCYGIGAMSFLALGAIFPKTPKKYIMAASFGLSVLSTLVAEIALINHELIALFPSVFAEHTAIPFIGAGLGYPDIADIPAGISGSALALGAAVLSIGVGKFFGKQFLKRDL